MSLLRRPPTKILLTAEEVRHSLEQAAKEEELRNLENERLRQLEEHKHKQMQAVQQQQQASESKKSTRTRSRDDRIGVGSSRAVGGAGPGRMTEHTRNVR
ncbi:hypothetical protein TWF569_006614 [Orbilia oligospora]|uniref:Uncharacterized protein n=2 Tax=Orbilia oligospora TaxID=2813651 RepID=G1XAZ3_ARTOA|nr:hypothetical protein AOL_s00078g90 [Orbilia oligospora ATCC 24927]KAF3082647.1 hypothetical protein TWF103_003273 [Orbilia oligospora]EGX49601.1 hypothetical protein AOL_s00078g90 [Orbilia oligospora ATCC 24927]KAF3087426.1 hypothetical protein TWF102_010497 [Orbilia oligospora]KAF3102250.1 hypothetical protein TWF706_005395 [Orbilia oligospora]KAF3120229.1 hypothetical protein TWF703_002687 [Orbilia oligospora]